jgi:hypothetical protein
MLITIQRCGVGAITAGLSVNHYSLGLEPSNLTVGRSTEIPSSKHSRRHCLQVSGCGSSTHNDVIVARRSVSLDLVLCEIANLLFVRCYSPICANVVNIVRFNSLIQTMYTLHL